MAGNESKIPVGTILVGKYRVVREIGRGGMAAVYESEQLSLGKKVAVKVLASELAASTVVIERFFREARAAASVRSPYIVDVYDSGRLDDGRPFIAMELLEGESLYDRMARVRIIDLETTIRCIVHTARGLVKAHSSGIVHRDLKPENIFLTKGEDQHDIVKILDFGLAKFYAPVNPEEKAAKRLTREGAVFGTPAYMSPEQVKGQGNVDHRADLWALGCMAYECLIGRPVWNMDQGVAMTFASIATGPIPVPSHARADLPPSFDAWFKKCLERDPKDRYQGAKELADAFVEAWGQRPVSSASYPGLPLGTGPHPRINEQAAGQLVGGVPSQRGGGLPPVPSSRRVDGQNGPMSARGSVASEPIPLVNGRASTDIPTTTSTPDVAMPVKTSPVRLGLAGGFLVGAVSLAIFTWVRFLGPQVTAPVVQSTTSATPVGSSDPNDQQPLNEPKWIVALAEGQRLFSIGDADAAQKKFKEVSDQGGNAAKVGNVFMEQTKWGGKDREKAACKVVSFAHPRLDITRRGTNPSIAPLAKGALVTWVDDHEQEKRNHVYGVVIDPTGKSITPVKDLTPERTTADSPKLGVIGSDRLALFYVEEKGKDAGIYARLIDGNGGTSDVKKIGGTKAGDFLPAIDKGPEGFWIAWQDDRDRDGEYDIWVKHLTNDLEQIVDNRRLVDFNTPPRKPADRRARRVGVTVTANKLLAVFRLENDKDKTHSIVRLRPTLAEAEKGLDESNNANRGDRFLGEVAEISEPKQQADLPQVACGKNGCFVAYALDNGGAMVARMDPDAGKVLWRNSISTKGGRPSLAKNDGEVAVVWYERPHIKMATLRDDAPNPPSSVLKINDPSVPAPSLAPGATKDEWYLSWQDSDTAKGVGEIYAARLTCK